MKKTQRKSNHAIASEWNNIAKFRHQQITKENDLSYNYVLIPSILSLIKNEFNSKKNLNILDAGCGTGNLAYQLSKRENSMYYWNRYKRREYQNCKRDLWKF